MKRWFDLRADERTTTWASFGALLSLTAGHTLLETERDALFLSRLPPAHLAWVYLAIAVLGVLLSIRGTKQTSRMTVIASLLGSAAVTLGFWALSSAPSRPFVYALYVWSGLFASWVTVRFWLLLGRAFTVTQAKRLYGLIGAGSVLGAVIGALVARGLVSFLPSRHLLLAGAVFIAAAAVPSAWVGAPASASGSGRAKAPPLMQAMRTVAYKPYARRVLAIVLVATITLSIGDYLFKAQVARNVPAADLGRFFSTTYVVFNTLSLVAQLVLSRWLLRVAGVQVTLLLTPLLLAAAAFYVALGGGLRGGLLFKGTDGALRYSVHRTSVELLFVPLAESARERLKPFVDLVGQRGGQALGSLAILGFAAFGPQSLGAVVFVLALGWATLAWLLRSAYLDVFRAALEQGSLGGEELPPLDLGALETLFSALNSATDMEVVAALDLLEAQHRERLVPALILYHPSKEVVLRALELFVRTERTDFVPIADRLVLTALPEVAAAALRARTHATRDPSVLRDLVDARARELRVTARIALATLDASTTDELAKELDDLEGAEPAVLKEAARSLEVEIPNLPEGAMKVIDRVLLHLLDHDDAEVIRAAARAIAVRGSVEFAPVLIAKLNRHDVRADVRAALARTPEAFEAIVSVLDDPDARYEVRLHLPRTLSLLEPMRAGKVLLDRLTPTTAGGLRFKVLKALTHLRKLDPRLQLEEAPLLAAVEHTLSQIAELIRWRLALEAPEGGERAARMLLLELLHDKEVHARDRLFRALALLDPKERFERIFRSLESSDARARAGGRELLEHVVRPALRARVLAAVDEASSLAERAEQLGATEPPLDLHAALFEMSDADSDTVRALARYHADELGLAPPSKRTMTREQKKSLASALSSEPRLQLAHAR